jgi:Ca2+-transporting ATPase
MTITEFQRIPAGLTTAEAAARLALDGTNVVAKPSRVSTARRTLRQLADPLIVLLLAALAVTVAIGDLTDAAIIALVVVVNTAIGVTQEVRADRAIAALDAVAAPEARVVRDGADTVIPAADVVRGDLVRLEAGDVVPADLRLCIAHRLRLDESAMTGESVPLDRNEGEEVLAGTVVVAGRGAGVVVRTGGESGLGRIAELVAFTRPGPTPLQRRLASLGRLLGGAVVVLSALVLVLGLLAGRPLVDMAVTAVSLVVAAVPESLPAVVTLSLALAARRMARRRAVPRRLHAVETLGSVTVVASDKTGTLTEGVMTVQRAVDATGAEFTISGHRYSPTGTVTARNGGTASPKLIELARAGVLCNDAVLLAPNGDAAEWRGVGDPVDAALVAFAERCGLRAEAERTAWPRVAEQPFDQQTRRMVTVHQSPGGDELIVCKGAPEAVLSTPLLGEIPAGALEQADELARAGLRVLAVATALRPADGSRDQTEPPAATEVAGLRLVGLVGIGDPVRAEAPAIARTFERAGIRLVLITGDHPATAAAIGGHVGIWSTGDEVHHGDAGTPDAERAGQVRVFARVPPEQKLDIIASLQASGHVVAMTGDGVNDAPALRRADIGVAMGGGTEVARQSADLVLMDDNLGTVADAVHEGRRIYDNIRRFLHYGLSGGIAELLVMLAGPFLGLAIPLLPGQILWVNLLTHGLPGVALGAEPADPSTMTRPPRPPNEAVLGGGLARAATMTGLLIGATVLTVGVVAAQTGRAWQSMVFVVLGLAQLGVAIAVRARRTPGGERNPGLAAAIALSALLQLAGVLVPPLRELLGTQFLPAPDLLWCVVAACVPAVLLMAGRRWLGKREVVDTIHT